MRKILLFLLCSLGLYAQTKSVSDASALGVVDNTAAVTTRPFVLAASDPGTCVAGKDFYVNNSGTPVLKICSTTNTYTNVGVSGSTPLSSLTAASGANTIASGDNAQIWNWALTTSGKSAFTFGETTAATSAGTPYLVNIQTLATSTANPLVVTAVGTANGIQVLKSGFLSSKGTGGVDSNTLHCDVTDGTKCIKNVLSGITTATTRNVTWPDAAITVARSDAAQTFTGVQTFSTPIALTSLASTVVNASSPGTGIAHFAGGTQTVTSSAVSLTADVSGVAPIANGGTNGTDAADNGGIVYSNASGYKILAHTTTAGLPLISGNATLPSWGTITGTGNFVMSASPTLTGTITAAAYTGSGVFTNNGSYAGSAVVPTANIAVALANQTSLRGNAMAATAGDATIGQVIAHGSKALDFASTATGACATVITDTATGTASTDVIIFTTNASIKAVTGYVPASTGGFSINAYPTTDTVNFEACNWTAGTVDPGSITVNWKVIR